MEHKISQDYQGGLVCVSTSCAVRKEANSGEAHRSPQSCLASQNGRRYQICRGVAVAVAVAVASACTVAAKMLVARTVAVEAAETAAAGIAVADTFAAGIEAAEMAGIGNPLAGEMIGT